jgi:catechol-2,3-dioxygenase
MKRRDFLKGAAAATLAAHTRLFGNQLGAMSPAEKSPVRILALRLCTSTPLEKMKAFYRGTLGLPIVEESAEAFTFAGGATQITFAQTKPQDGEPFYHVAFNIPENKIVGAYNWQKQRTPLDRIGDHLRDPILPADIVHFRHWNARSVFFWDPAGNLIEYIARHDLKNSAGGSFSPTDILYASEIAFIADDVTNTAVEIKTALGLDQYRDGNDRFRALGDEHGLLLVIYRGRRWGYNQAAARPTSVFPTVVEIRGAKPGKVSVAGFPYEITTRG